MSYTHRARLYSLLLSGFLLTGCLSPNTADIPSEPSPPVDADLSAVPVLPEEELSSPVVIRRDGYTLTEIPITEQYPKDVFPAVTAWRVIPGTEYLISIHNAVYPNSLAILEMYRYGIVSREGETVLPCSFYYPLMLTNRGDFILIDDVYGGVYSPSMERQTEKILTYGYEVYGGEYFLLQGADNQYPYFCRYTEPLSDKSYRCVVYQDGVFYAYHYDSVRYIPLRDTLAMDGSVLEADTVVTEQEMLAASDIRCTPMLDRTALEIVRTDYSTFTLRDQNGNDILTETFENGRLDISPVTENGEAIVRMGDTSYLLRIESFSGTYLP